MISPFSQTVQVKEALINLLMASMSASGALPTVESIGPTYLNEVGVNNYVGVEVFHIVEKPWSRRVEVTISFGISISVKSPTDKLQDAYPIRDYIIDAGDGIHGIQPILRAQMSTLYPGAYLDGLIASSNIKETILISSTAAPNANIPTAYVAEAAIMWDCVFYLSF